MFGPERHNQRSATGGRAVQHMFSAAPGRRRTVSSPGACSSGMGSVRSNQACARNAGESPVAGGVINGMLRTGNGRPSGRQSKSIESDYSERQKGALCWYFNAARRKTRRRACAPERVREGGMGTSKTSRLQIEVSLMGKPARRAKPTGVEFTRAARRRCRELFGVSPSNIQRYVRLACRGAVEGGATASE